MAENVPELTPQQQRFVEEYAKDRNGVRSALAAGLSDSYFAANFAARQLLQKPSIRAALKAIFRIQAKRLKTEVPDVVREWAIIGLADITDYAVDEDGRAEVLPGVPKAALRAVKKVKRTRSERLVGPADNQQLVVEIKVEIELHDKLKALSDLYAHLHGAIPGESRDKGLTVEQRTRLLALDGAHRGRTGTAPGGEPVVPEPGAAEPRVSERSG